jgi:hypothetical protein
MLDWIEVGGAGWVQLERNSVALKEGEHDFRGVYSGVILLKERTAESRLYVLEDGNEPAA